MTTSPVKAATKLVGRPFVQKINIAGAKLALCRQAELAGSDDANKQGGQAKRADKVGSKTTHFQVDISAHLCHNEGKMSELLNMLGGPGKMQQTDVEQCGTKSYITL